MQAKIQLHNLDNYQKYLLISKTIEDFLSKRSYLKVELPVLSPALIPESYLEVFETDFIFLNKKEKLYLTPSPELFLKQLIAYGIGNCYYLGKSFRNSDPSATLHSFEFMMLEYYKTKATYMDIADELLQMLQKITAVIYKDNKSQFLARYRYFKKWEWLTVAQAFEKYASISEEELFDKKLFIKKASLKKYQTNGFDYDDLFSQIYTQEVEPHLGKKGHPTIIYDYPKEFAALARLNHDGRTAQRFEFYIDGVEIGDCYTELTDWKEQQIRFLDEAKKRSLQKKNHHPIDKGLIDALKLGLVDCAGIAIGIERLAMVFCKARSINDLKLVNIE